MPGSPASIEKVEAMWMQCKPKRDIKLKDLMKMFRNKDIDVILQHPKNKEVVKLYKANKDIPKGTPVWLLDPCVTVYITTLPGGKKEVISEKEWKDTVTKAHKAMDFALKQYKSTHETMVYRHDLQNKALDEFYITSLFTASWWGEEGREPKKQKAASAAAVKTLEKVVKARDYKRFEAAVRDAETKIKAYGKGIDAYIAQHTGSAGNWETGLTWVKNGGFVIFGALAMTVAAPATAAGTLGYGALVGAGTSAMSSSANEAGRHWSGQNVTFSGSAKTVAKDIVYGGVLGALSAGAAKAIAGPLIGKFAEKLASRQLVSALINRASLSRFWPEMGRRVYERELNALMQSLSKEVADDAAGALIKITPQILDRMCVNVTIKVMSRLGVGTFRKSCEVAYKKHKVEKWTENYLKKNATKLKGNMTDEQVADLMAKDLANDPVAAEVLKMAVRSNAKVIEAELAKEIRKELERQIKANAKGKK